MKSILRLIPILLLSIFLFAFTGGKDEGIENTFGVCHTDNCPIKLNLHKDFTFTYQDLSVSDRPIKVQGHYTLKGRKVILEANDHDMRFHSKWKISEDGTTARARKGLCFYILRSKDCLSGCH